MRPFVVQIWDADFKDPSDQDGGNQDYFIIDIYKEGTTFNVENCQPQEPENNPGCQVNCDGANNPNPQCVVNCGGTTQRPVTAPTPTPAQGVEAVAVRRQARGTARIAGARTCPATPFSLRVSGRRIRRVTYFVDGRRVATVTRADAAGRWRARVDPRRLRSGTHRVRAQVQFVSGAGPSRALRMSFRVCARPARRVQPSFTG
jgi:hypothetical protein